MTTVAIMGRPTCESCAKERQISTMLPPKDLIKIDFCQFDCGYPSKRREKIEISIQTPTLCPCCKAGIAATGATGPAPN